MKMIAMSFFHLLILRVERFDFGRDFVSSTLSINR